MSDVFLKVLNMSIAAGWLVLAVVALRLLFKKAPKWIACALWAVVAIRLICPFSLESALSLIPSAETVGPEILYAQEPVIHSGVPAINSALNPVISGSFTPSPGASVNPLQIWTAIAAYVWLAGVAAMLIYAAVSFLRLRKKVGASLHVRDGVWVCDDIKTPFILGVFRPRIYLPSGMDTETEAYVVAHETAHLKRRDHLWKPLGFLILSVYWFNPLCWLAYILLCRDIELACDERVIRGMEKDAMLSYSEALLSCSVPRGQISACPLAFGEVGVKERVKTVLNYKKPAFWIIVVAVVACVVVAVCFLTNPKPDMPPQEGDAQGVGVRLISEISPQSDSITIEWINTTDNEAAYGDAYDIQRFENGEWVSCAKTEAVFHMPAYSLRAGGSAEKEYSLANYDLARPGEYRFTAKFHFQKDVPITEDESHMVWVSFRIESLSLGDVITLSQKGEKLTWADFDNYPYIETGSGLYIRVYEIDEQFFLIIVGGSTEESPMYIRLVSEANHDDYADVRTEDVESFIAEHGGSVSAVGGAELTGIAYQTAYSWANYSEDGYAAMVERAENRDTERRYGNIEHLTPVVKLDSKVEFDDFYEEMSAYFDLTQGYDEVGAFSAQTEQYTEEFFAEQSLFIAYLEENTTSNRHEVEEVRIESGILEIRICQIAPDNFDTAMAGWFISVAVPKADIANCTGYDAYISATVYPYRQIPSGKLLRTYAYDGDDGLMHTAAVSLYDSGEFIFTFSPISSYIGHGAYTMENNRLILQTDDGSYTYVFDVANDTLVFDGGASSTATWYSGFTDGAVFD